MFHSFFRIRHFAGSVQYSIDGFLEKNAEFLPRNVSTCLYQSKLPVVQSLFPEGKIFLLTSTPIDFTNTFNQQAIQNDYHENQLA